MEYWALWLIIVILLAIIEFATVNLVSIWFVASGIIALFTSLITDNFFIQFGVFALLGLVFMIFTKPLLNKVMKKQNEKLNLDRVIGMEGIVTEEIKKNMVGEVKVDGKRWSAIASSNIPVETIVAVESIEGVKLVVSSVEKKEEKTEEVEEVREEKKTEKKKATTTSGKKTTKAKTSSSKSTSKKETASKTTAKKTSSGKSSTTKKASSSKPTTAKKASSSKSTTAKTTTKKKASTTTKTSSTKKKESEN